MEYDIEFQEAVEMLRDWNETHQQQFYHLFPETVQQEKIYDLMGIWQHEDEGFARDLQGEEFNGEHLDAGTHRSLKSQLAKLSTTAAKEAAATQNLTVYNHAEELWQKAEDTEELLNYLQAYANQRTDWNERTNHTDTEEPLLQQPTLQYGDSEDTEYIEEILTQLVTETMHEV